MAFDRTPPQVPTLSLGQAAKGFAGQVLVIEVRDHASSLSAAEIERRLIELGFVEGAQVQILHEGLFGRDPIAVRVNGATVALRRREAMAIQVV
ncbi:MAG: FeoA family protein [Cypionkella sp.]